MVPVGIVGVFFKDEVEGFFSGSLLLTGSALMATGLLLAFTHFSKNHIKDINPVNAFIIGIAQAVAVIPGISRSGATIATSLLLGVDKEKAARFSFLMVLPPIFGATLLEIKDFTEASATHPPVQLGALIIGFLGAFVSGLLACQWMIKLVKKGKLIYFSYYCIAVSIIAISFHFA